MRVVMRQVEETLDGPAAAVAQDRSCSAAQTGPAPFLDMYCKGALLQDSTSELPFSRLTYVRTYIQMRCAQIRHRAFF